MKAEEKLEKYKMLFQTKKSLELFKEEYADALDLWVEILKNYAGIGKTIGKTTWKDVADRVYSQYIRMSRSQNGMCKCISCGVVLPIQEMQAGHFVSRGVLKYRFDDRNVRPQCKRCNLMLSGNYKPYTVAMIDMFGKGFVEFIINDKSTVKLGVDWYQEHILEWYGYVEKFKKYRLG